MASSFSFFSSVFGFVAASISLFAFIVKICQSHLPSNKIKSLECLLDETETFFKKAIEDGLLTEPDFVHATERHLSILRTRTHILRSNAYNATTLCKDYMEMLRGTSSAIGRTCDSLKKLRAHVVTSSEEGRRRQTKYMNTVPHTASLPGISFPEVNFEHQAIPSLSRKIPRSRSCPPTVSGRKPAQHTVELGPFCRAMLGGMNVRTADAQSCASTVHTSVTLEPGA